MYIMAENQMQILDSDFVERFAVAVKPDAALILASYSSGEEKPPITIGRYRDKDEATKVLADLFISLINAQDGGECYYYMPASEYYAEHRKMDARTKRRGGS